VSEPQTVTVAVTFSDGSTRQWSVLAVSHAEAARAALSYARHEKGKTPTAARVIER
jgi:hypothetical protein